MINPKEIIEDYNKYLGIDISINDIPKISRFKTKYLTIDRLSGDGYFIKINYYKFYYNFKTKKFQKYDSLIKEEFFTKDIMDCLEIVYNSGINWDLKINELEKDKTQE